MLPSFSEKEAVIVGISPDTPESHTKFITKHNLAVELLSDPDHTVCAFYGVWKKKKLYGREYFGVARTTVLIDKKGVIRNFWENVKVSDHAETVFNALCNLRTTGT